MCDPSAGSCGFLVGTAEYLSQHYRQEIFGNPAAKEHFEKSLFMGMEFDATMIRIGAMNLLQHGIESPQLYDVDALSEANSAFVEKASLILANPPFKGTLDQEAVEKNIAATVSTKKTELLFLALILRGLKIGGRAAVIVPDGVLFGSSKAHTQIRKEIIENHQLQAVISLPSGVFKPYAGVSTAVLIFTKTNSGGTQNVWFYDLKADGYSLDDKRQPLGFQPQTLETDGQTAKSDWTLFDEWLAGSKHEDNNLADVLTRWQNLSEEASRSRTEQSFLVPLEEIRANGYDLSINRYKEVVYEAKTYDRPEDIIEQIQELDRQRQSALELLKEMLSKDSVVNA
nr:N-6 DNA methylase [Siphonobacter sp. BAB-5385]